MCLLNLDPDSSRRTSARLLSLLIVLLALSVALPSLADHLHLTTARAVNTLAFVQGFLIAFAITILALSALLARRRRSRSGPASPTR